MIISYIGADMNGYKADEVKDCYNRTAKEYADKFLNELDGKPFDRNILNRFSDMLPAGSLIYDFGCGSGQTTKYIYEKQKHKTIGLDFSENAIQLAKQNFKEIEFVVDDMLNSKMASGSADGILAFYAVVHFTYIEIEHVLKEWLRLLKPNAIVLFSFHVGEEAIEVVDFLGVSGAKATWHFLNTDHVLEIAGKVGFKVEEAVVRYPYIGYEHESKRAYIMLRKDAHK
jgi:SAM-dependent methyltransferase